VDVDERAVVALQAEDVEAVDRAVRAEQRRDAARVERRADEEQRQVRARGLDLLERAQRGGTTPLRSTSASAATVGPWKNVITGTARPNAASTRASSATTANECPPSSKKLSSRPTRATPSCSRTARARRRSIASAGRPRLVSSRPTLFGDRRPHQRAAIDLAVRRRRQHVDGDVRRRHHHRRQVGPRVCAQRVGVEHPARHDERDEPRAEGPVAAQHGDAPLDGRVSAEDRLDLPELDARAAQLHLVIARPRYSRAPLGARRTRSPVR
jgi:hypothetical protein